MKRAEIKEASADNRLFLRRGVGPLSAGTKVVLVSEKPLFVAPVTLSYDKTHWLSVHKDDLVARRRNR